MNEEVRELLTKLWRTEWQSQPMNAAQLRHKAARHGTLLTMAEAKRFLDSQSGTAKEAQEITAPPRPYKGNVAAEGPNERWQADIGFFRKRVQKKGQEDQRAFLLVVDVFTRFVRTKAIPNKQPSTVLAAFRDIAPAKRGLTLTTDRGKEFEGEFRAYLEEKGVIWRIRTMGAANDIAVADNAMGNIKKRVMLLARAAASNDWPNFLPKATDDFNDTLKEGLHGSPKDAQSKSERASVQKFMLLQDNAEKLRRNDELDSKRQFELADRGGTLRPPIQPANAFASRSTSEKYGDVSSREAYPQSHLIHFHPQAPPGLPPSKAIWSHQLHIPPLCTIHGALV